MAQRSLPQAGTGVGDAGPYTDDEWAEFFETAFTGDQSATQGPFKNYLNELRVTSPAALTIRIHTGSGFSYGHWMVNDAINDITIAAAAASRPDRVVICQNNTNANYDGTPDYGAICVTPVVPRNSTRLAVLYGVEPATQRPLMTPATSANAYMVEIASYTITGVIVGAITDSRDFCRYSTEIDTEAISDGAVTPAKILDRTISFFVPCTGYNQDTTNNLVYTHVLGIPMADAVTCDAFGAFIVSDRFVSGLTATALVSTVSSSGNVYSRNSAGYGECGDSYASHTASSGIVVVAITALMNNCIQQITLTNVMIGDIVRLRYERFGGGAPDTIGDIVYMQGWIVTYTADS